MENGVDPPSFRRIFLKSGPPSAGPPISRSGAPPCHSQHHQAGSPASSISSRPPASCLGSRIATPNRVHQKAKCDSSCQARNRKKPVCIRDQDTYPVVSHPTLFRNHTLQLHRHPPAVHRRGRPRAMASRAGKEQLTGLGRLPGPCVPHCRTCAPPRCGAACQAQCGANPDFASFPINLPLARRA